MRRVRRNLVLGILALVLAAPALATAPAFGAQSISAVAVVTRPGTGDATLVIHPRGLNPDQRYQVRFENDTNMYLQPSLFPLGKPTTSSARRCAAAARVIIHTSEDCSRN